MDDFIKKYRDRLRIIIILYTFCDKLEQNNDYYGEFRSEIKIQALDFLLRYPDFLSIELMDLTENDSSLDKEEVKQIILEIYSQNEPKIRVEEMEKFFHGAYESIDEVIAFLVSVDFVKYDSKRRIDGKNYDRIYNLTKKCAFLIDSQLKYIPAINWYFKRCTIIKKYFDKFSGTELKTRQYRYSEYSNISYKSHIQNINDKVKLAFEKRFNELLT